MDCVNCRVIKIFPSNWIFRADKDMINATAFYAANDAGLSKPSMIY